MRILVCVDGSENSDVAFHRALHMYALHGGQLFVLFGHSNAETKAEREKDIQVMQGYAKVLLKKKIHSQMIADPAPMTIGELIIEKAVENRVDVIVLGRRGMSKTQRLFAGSVSRYVMEKAPCDVFVIRPKVEKGPEDPKEAPKDPKEAPKDPKAHKETVHEDTPKQVPQETPKEAPLETPEETPQETPK